jgi:hypothetical protein
MKMLFKGLQFRRNRNLVAIPTDSFSNICFGKICDPGAPGAIKTTYVYNGSRDPVYAKPVEVTGHGLTNMAYGAKNQVYLMKDGAFYQATR